MLESWKSLLPWQRNKSLEAARLRIEGRLVVLRSKLPEDAVRDHAWRQDPELAALDATKPLSLSLQDYVRYHRDDLMYPSPWSMRLAIETLQGRHIGNCMYYDIDNIKRQAEMGIMIGDRAYWGKGYGTDAVITLLHHVFNDTTIERLYLHTLEHNVRAQKAFIKAGFKRLRLVNRDGYSFVKMEAIRDNWLEGHAAEPGDGDPE